MTEPVVIEALAAAARALRQRQERFALIGGLAVSVHGEVRFTRDVDLAVAVMDDEAAERLVYGLRADGFEPFASVEHGERERLSTVRLLSPQGVKIDLIFASSGIETEAVERATVIDVPGTGPLPVACVEELVAMKTLSMTNRRLQDRIDAQRLLEHTNGLDLDRVRANLGLIRQRGYDRGEDLEAKLASLLAEIRLG
ncbi:nucleotidyl transferase AbiEii/AbiGii toxin family protein [Paraliomyxa miuraensis]|uniref:nucleotidyl transferase AbiEii/AbiGii toxin family protein n=1 Tax=Paraliomyxa miuraensis TaxID=376150 RepID=UPI002250A1C4|nr:nucleotidyl transferase AbiEii/AbiGii toxin family protein [Paraliomyxa miuraensis]MCX4244321.1 nucleotidyl transferase AbiEii/AbiGii toxin family protein [Paraliomyxa miuraensis]